MREFIHESQKQGHFRIEREKTNNLHIFAYFPANYPGRHFGYKKITRPDSKFVDLSNEANFDGQ